MGSAICGGGHYSIKTYEQLKEHQKLDPMYCIDCCSGCPYGFQFNQKLLDAVKKKLHREIAKDYKEVRHRKYYGNNTKVRNK
jgi:hypothetical protein